MVNTKVLILMLILLFTAMAVAVITFFSNSLKANSVVNNFQEPTSTINATKTIETETGFLVLDDFYYPGAEVVSLSGNSFQLRSFDDVQEITDWYKGVINDRNMSIKTFIQSNSNGQISNQLIGVGQKEQVKITINKNGLAVMIAVLITSQNDN